MMLVNRARVRPALGAALVASMAWVLSACGGGGGEPPLEVAVSVNGVPDASNPLTIGEATTINVASGSTLVFTSEEDTRWAPVATSSSFSVNSFSVTEKSMTVSSDAGGTVQVVFSDARDEAKTASLTVVVAPKEFARVAPREGQFFDMAVRLTDLEGGVTTWDERLITRLDGSGGNYAEEVWSGDAYQYIVSRELYDHLGRYLGWDHPHAPLACTNSQPLVNHSYPLHVGKTWSGATSRRCDGGPANYDLAYERSVEAFEPVTVPAGTFNTLRIRSEQRVSNISIAGVPSAYDVIRTCWWAVDLGRDVKCEYSYDYPAGTAGTLTASVVETLQSHGL